MRYAEQPPAFLKYNPPSTSSFTEAESPVQMSHRSFRAARHPLHSTMDSKAGRMFRLTSRGNVGMHRTWVAVAGPTNQNMVHRCADKNESPTTLSHQGTSATVKPACIE